MTPAKDWEFIRAALETLSQQKREFPDHRRLGRMACRVCRMGLSMMGRVEISSSFAAVVYLVSVLKTSATKGTANCQSYIGVL